MSKEINNRAYRQKVLKDMITALHDGRTVDEVKAQFETVFGGVSAEEIAQAEQALIEGGLPVTEVQRLCDVHAAVFKGSIQEIHAPKETWAVSGHPADTLIRENRAIEKVMATVRDLLTVLPEGEAHGDLNNALKSLNDIAIHYAVKENLFFPYMEKYGIYGPPKVMWGVDDEVRTGLKEAFTLLNTANAATIINKLNPLLDKISEMIFKEENIMLPMLMENLTQDDWARIAEETEEIGYCLIDKPDVWNPVQDVAPPAPSIPDGDIVLPTGVFKAQELARMLDTLPIDITFVGKDDTVHYFSQAAERVFPRTKAIIGRNVSNCHPPASAHIVEGIIADLKSGAKDNEDFWINMGPDKYIYIRYFAVRSDKGEYLGVLEVTQNIRPIQAITGEKRLVTG